MIDRLFKQYLQHLMKLSRKYKLLFYKLINDKLNDIIK